MFDPPHINNVKDLLPFVEDNSDITIQVKQTPDGETYQKFCYHVMHNEMFVGDVGRYERECRGITFDGEGNIIARPFHKFFNLNEREETRFENLDFTSPYFIQEKLDGSMVHPFVINGKVYWSTKAGITEYSDDAVRIIGKTSGIDYDDFAYACYFQGLTPIFEVISLKPQYRHIENYSEESVTLLAIREMVSGRYFESNEMQSWSHLWNIPIVEEHQININQHSVQEIKNMKGREGFVVTFQNGDKIKIKTDEHIMIHNARENVRRMNNVAEVILNGSVDDLIPLLTDADRERVDQIYEALIYEIHSLVATCRFAKNLFDADIMSRKEFALQKEIDPFVKSLCFRCFDKDFTNMEQEIREIVEDAILWNCGRPVKFQKMLDSNQNTFYELRKIQKEFEIA